LTTTTDVNNGVERQRGRAAPPEKLWPHQFQDSGRSAHVRKLPSFWRDTIRRQVVREEAFKKPEPPWAEVDYGEGKVRMRNLAHPVYQQLMADWVQRVNAEVGERVMPFVIRNGVVCEVDDELVRQARITAAESGVDLSDYDDHAVYVAFVLIGSYEDWTDLLRAVFERSSPQEAAIEAYKESF